MNVILQLAQSTPTNSGNKETRKITYRLLQQPQDSPLLLGNTASEIQMQ